MTEHHLAQLNVALPREPLDHPAMADFVARLDEINALADTAPGFVWRLVEDGASDATALRPYGPDVMVNMSVWESVETLYDYLYRTAHLDLLRRRREWFTHDGLGAHSVLWWIPAGTIPTLDEARRRLDLLAEHGPTAEAFTFQQRFTAADAAGGKEVAFSDSAADAAGGEEVAFSDPASAAGVAPR